MDSYPSAADRKIPAITWIIPVYNSEKYIRQAVESILKQPCQDFQILVIDDGSNDHTKAIVKKLQSHNEKVGYIFKQNGGVSSARNEGIRNTSSPYLAFMDADDVLCRNAYTEDIHDLVISGAYELISFPYIMANEQMTRGNFSDITDPASYKSDAAINCFKHISSFLYNASILKNEYPLLFSEETCIQEDVIFLFQVLHRAKSIKKEERYWFVYRNNPNSALYKINIQEKIIKEAVPAWHTCRETCNSIDMINQCDARLFSNVAYYITSSCRAGLATETILKTLQAAPLQEAIANYDSLWKESRQIYESFTRDPEKFRRNLKRQRPVYNLLHQIARNPFFRQVYHHMKYRSDIRRYIL